MSNKTINPRNEQKPSLVPPVLAAISSLIVPGLGQTFARSFRKGLLIFLSFASLVALWAWRIRIIARLDFRLEERTAELLENARDLLARVSGERIEHELALMFREAEPEKALQVADQLGILAAIHPELND